MHAVRASRSRAVVFGALLVAVATLLPPWISGNAILGFVDIPGSATIGGVVALAIAFGIGLSQLALRMTRQAELVKWLPIGLGVALLGVISVDALALQQLPVDSFYWDSARPGVGMYIAALGGLLAIGGGTAGPGGSISGRHGLDTTGLLTRVRRTGALVGISVGAAWVALFLLAMITFGLSLGVWTAPLVVFPY